MTTPTAGPPTGLAPDQAAQLGRLVDVYPAARELGELFAAAGHELYLVGGTVRDTLLASGDDDALDDVDLDFATSARPEETEQLLNGWADVVWLTGARFGTISCEKRYRAAPTRQIEITTFRADTYTSGSRHPEVRFGDTIDGDLARRDFTINAMAVRVPDFVFVDLFNGLTDLRNAVLRTPIDPHESFGDDPLRMLRLARFAATLDATADPDTLVAATEMAAQLANISAERIRDEFTKLLASANPRRGVQLLLRAGLADHFLPELAELRACRDPMHRHKDVYLHTLAVLENAMGLEVDGPDLVLRLAALLHDVGKPETRRILDDGNVTFHHHEVVGARQVKARLQAMKFDNETTRSVTELVRLHLRFHTYAMGWTDGAVRRYARDAGPLLDRLNKLTRADATTANKRKAETFSRRMDELEERVRQLSEREELDAMRPAIDGAAIMAHLDLAPGPVIGEAWNHLLELRIEQGPMDEDEALAALDAWWAQRPSA